jgi:hypothetical protein
VRLRQRVERFHGLADSEDRGVSARVSTGAQRCLRRIGSAPATRFGGRRFDTAEGHDGPGGSRGQPHPRRRFRLASRGQCWGMGRAGGAHSTTGAAATGEQISGMVSRASREREMGDQTRDHLPSGFGRSPLCGGTVGMRLYAFYAKHRYSKPADGNRSPNEN